MVTFMGIRRAGAIFLVGSATALASFAALADIAECRALIGFDTANGGIVTGGAWAVVEANGDSFLGRKTVANCEVKIVTSTGKGKPGQSVFLAGPMAQDECSMYNHLSSADAKLVMGKTGDALTTIGSMIAKIDGLNAKGKLAEPGYTPIRDAASAIQECIVLLP